MKTPITIIIIALLPLLFTADIWHGYNYYPDASDKSMLKQQQTTGVSSDVALLPKFAAKIPPIEMKYVEGGTFQMGCNAGQDGQCASDEVPVHSVTVGNFYIGVYEVTVAQWKAVMGNNPSYCKHEDNYPVDDITWENAQAFIAGLNAATGKHYRLPTEAEWEYAARGGNQSKGYKYGGSNTADDVAWHRGNCDDCSQPVGTKKPNELGIYDMSGNVFEWCEDRYGAYPGAQQAAPACASSEKLRVLRGGCWMNLATSCRVTYRGIRNQNERYGHYGMRLVHP